MEQKNILNLPNAEDVRAEATIINSINVHSALETESKKLLVINAKEKDSASSK